MRKTKLGVLVSDARKKKCMTVRDVEGLSKGKIANATISHIETGRVKRASPSTLRVLAAVLNIKYTTLMKAAGHL